MPTNYNGIPGNASQPAAVNIASSTNTNPIQVTVSGALPASYTTGIAVTIAGHTSNLAANGRWPITVTGASTFTIPTAGSGVGGATGTVQPLSVSPLYTYPSDGDLDNQASIAAWAQATGDRTQFLAAAASPYKMVGFQSQQNVDDTYSSAWGTLTTTNVRQVFSGSGAVFVGIPVQANDVVEANFRGTIALQQNSAVTVLDLGFANYNYGGVPSYSIGRVSTAYIGNTGFAAWLPVNLTYLSLPSDITINGLAALRLTGFGALGTTANLQMLGSWIWTVKIWRPTGLVA